MKVIRDRIPVASGPVFTPDGRANSLYLNELFDAVANGVRAWVGFTRPIPVPLTQWLLPNLEPFRVAAAVTLKGDSAADIEKQTRDAFEKRADTIVNSASQANQAQYAQAVVDSLVERGLASTFRADGDRTATL